MQNALNYFYPYELKVNLKLLSESSNLFILKIEYYLLEVDLPGKKVPVS